MGVVYRGLDLRLDRHVALKFLPPETSRDSEARERLTQEAKAASALDHPNICTIHEIDATPEGQLFIAMAYYDGETLKKRIARGDLSVDESLDISIQVARGLAEAHAAGILHRDIKPANVMLTKSGLVKIVDFGIAKVLDVTGPMRSRMLPPLALVGLIAVVAGLWFAARDEEAAWARNEALPQIQRLLDSDQYSSAFVVALRAEQHLPNDPALAQYWPQISRTLSFTTTPEGATISFSPPLASFDYLIKSGRAVIYPVFKDTFERRTGLTFTDPTTSRSYVEHVVWWVKDVKRSLDYLDSRSDIARDKVAFLGFSWGGRIGNIVLAVEPRFKTGVLNSGGFPLMQSLPEVKEINFAPRITIPVLMANGRHDRVFPLETSQKPMFKFLGTAAGHKKHVVYNAGHGMVKARSQHAAEVLAWLDRYLGPVQ